MYTAVDNSSPIIHPSFGRAEGLAGTQYGCRGGPVTPFEASSKTFRPANRKDDPGTSWTLVKENQLLSLKIPDSNLEYLNTKFGGFPLLNLV